MSRLEVDTIEELQAHLSDGTDLSGAAFQSLRLGRELLPQLAKATLQNNILLGCDVDSDVMEYFQSPIVFPRIPDLPFKPYRNQLYTPAELLGGYEIGNASSYATTIDGATYEQYVAQGKSQTTNVAITLARRLHDHAVTDALQDFLIGKQVVAIMGGHSMPRSTGSYLDIAVLARGLTREGFLVTSGGGPGAMEAAHLGAWFAEREQVELENAVEILSLAPGYEPMGRWLDQAFRVVEKYPLTSETQCMSLGIPTWLYGHEPPTCFATRIAKYFANSVREEGLLAIAKGGVIFSPGSAGTIQEVFQDATQNHYKSFGMASPMIFFGKRFWTEEKPVYPLLYQLAEGYDYQRWMSITDDGDEIIRSLKEFANGSRSA